MWSDPTECEAAKRYLAAGNPAAAAGVLLDCDQANHAAVRALLLTCQTELLALAEQALGDGHLESCQELLDQALKCGPLPGHAATLPERLRNRRNEPATTVDLSPARPQPKQVEPLAPSAGERPLTDRSQRFALGREALVVSCCCAKWTGSGSIFPAHWSHR